MLPKRDDPIPLSALRDLIGLTRAIYAAEKADRAPPERLAKIARIGRDLQEALKMAKEAKPGTLAYYAAWVAGEKATHATQDLADILSRRTAPSRAASRRGRRLGALPATRGRTDGRRRRP